MGTGRGKVIDGSIASRVELTGIVGRGGSDREDQHRKQIMGVGRIVEVDAYGGAEARSETPAGSRAAPATEPLPSDSDAVDYGRGGGPCQLTRPGAEPGVRNDAQSSDKLIHDPSGGIEGLSALLDLDFRQQLLDDAVEVLSVVRQLGGDSKSYVRERRAAVRHIVSEIYSPPRDAGGNIVTRVAMYSRLCVGSYYKG